MIRFAAMLTRIHTENYDIDKITYVDREWNPEQEYSLEGCYANHYTIDALGSLLIFEARNYTFKSKIQIQKEHASSENRTRAENDMQQCMFKGFFL